MCDRDCYRSPCSVYMLCVLVTHVVDMPHVVT